MAAKARKSAKARAVPSILPREPLTKKAEAAIFKYATVRADNRGPYIFIIVKYVLQAERMRRQSLYEWLESKGYRWHSKVGSWVKKETDS